MKEVIEWFSPNRTLSQRSTQILVASQLVIFLIIWMTSGFALLPKPPAIASAFTEMWSEQDLGQELLTSFFLNLEAISISLIVSLVLAYLTVLPFFRPLVTVLSKFRFLSLAGLTFFFTVMTTGAHELKLSLLVFSVSVFFITSMADVIQGVPREMFDLARTLGMGEWRVVWEVIILGRIDIVFDVLRQNAAIGWMMLTMVEGMSRSEGGVGALLLNQNKHFHLEAVLAIQITILVLGLGQDYVISLLKKMCCPYADLKLERK